MCIRDRANSDSLLIDFLQKVSRNREKEYILVVIRPSGIENFNLVRELVELRNIDIGFVPFREKRPLIIKNSIEV